MSVESEMTGFDDIEHINFDEEAPQEAKAI
jgi:hypothetical protein